MGGDNQQPVAVITGAAEGIGSCVCRRFAADGYAIAIIDVNQRAGKALEAELEESGYVAKMFPCDLRDPQQIDRAFCEIAERFGQIDVLVNNAGVGGYCDWSSMDKDAWHAFTSVNCDAAFLCVQHAAQQMVQAQVAGRIVIVLSQASMNQDETIVVPYGVSKWCERGLMKAAAADLAPHGISVNGVCPGTVWTPMMERFCDEFIASGGGTEQEYRAFIEGKYPTHRLQTADDIAAMCAFAARPGTHMSGQTLLVAGGIVVD